MSHTVPTVPREPGSDDDLPIDRAWLAEFNRLIGREELGRDATSADLIAARERYGLA